jgi:hypothetical protein
MINLKNLLKFLLILLALSFIQSCYGPPKLEKFVNVESSETAFLIPLDVNKTSKQARILSEDYLKERMVSAKRISIPQRKMKTGRWDNDYEWIPSMRVIKVDRTPITREWTQSPQTGTSNNDDAILSESKDSIAFRLGVTISVSIKAEEAAKFLYNFNGKDLKSIVDTNIRGLVQNIMSREFNKYDLTECKKVKGDVIEITFTTVRDFFDKKGITVEYLGLASGMIYEDKEIQEAINQKFIAENKKDIMMKQLESERESNKIKVEKSKMEMQIRLEEAKNESEINQKRAESEIKIAKSYGANIKNIIQLKKIEIQGKELEIQKRFIEQWNGQLPSTMSNPGMFPMLQRVLNGDLKNE